MRVCVCVWGSESESEITLGPKGINTHWGFGPHVPKKKCLERKNPAKRQNITKQNLLSKIKKCKEVSNNFSLSVTFTFHMKSLFAKKGWVFFTGQVSDYIVNPIKQVLSVWIYLPADNWNFLAGPVKQARKAPSYACSKLWLADSLTGVKCRATSVAKNSPCTWYIVLCTCCIHKSIPGIRTAIKN